MKILIQLLHIHIYGEMRGVLPTMHWLSPQCVPECKRLLTVFVFFRRQIPGWFEVNEVWWKAGRQGIDTRGLWHVIKNRKDLRGRECTARGREVYVRDGWSER